MNKFPEYHPPASDYTCYFPDSIGHQPRKSILASYPQLRARHWILGFLAGLLLMGSKIIVVYFCVYAWCLWKSKEGIDLPEL